MFNAIDGLKTEEIAKMIHQVDIEPDSVLFQQGQEFTNFYFIKSGIIKLCSVSEEGCENVIEIMHTGNYFAESLMFINHPRYPVRSVAITKTTVIAIDSSQYRDLVSQSKNGAFNLLGNFSRRIHNLVKQLDDLSFHSTRSRVASYLLKCAEMYGSLSFALDIPKSTVASRLSMKPETLSRALHHFDQLGTISVSKKVITINNKQDLIEFIVNDS